MTSGEGELSEEGCAMGGVPMRERAVPSLRAPEDVDGRQVASAVRDRVAHLDPTIEAVDHVVGAAPSTGAGARPPWSRIITEKPEQTTDLARVGCAEATDLPGCQFDQGTGGGQQSQILGVVRPVGRGSVMAASAVLT